MPDQPLSIPVLVNDKLRGLVGLRRAARMEDQTDQANEYTDQINDILDDLLEQEDAA